MIGELLAVIATMPDLNGAACRGRHELYDKAALGDPLAQEQAQQVCELCPVLLPCSRWLRSTPRDLRPGGVTAGQINRDYRRRQRGAGR
jgi:hypothetical protein